MAIEVMAEIINARLGPWRGGDLLVLLMLGSYADADGTNIYPRVATLARACRMQTRNTQICLKALKEDGVLVQVSEADGHPGRFNEYRIDMERLQSLQGCKVCRGAICDDEGCKKQPKGVQKPVRHIDKRPSPVLDTSCPREAALPEGPPLARQIWARIEERLGGAKFRSYCAQGTPLMVDDRLEVSFPNAFRAERAQSFINEIEKVSPCKVIIRFQAPVAQRGRISW